MEKHEEKSCPRCQRPFICRMSDITRCQCSCVQLSAETRKFLEKTFFDCLCQSCLIELNQAIKTAGSYRFPTQKEMLTEGLHYYKEGNAWVFTPLYHLLRGHCCQNGCRHCVYGFSKRNS